MRCRNAIYKETSLEAKKLLYAAHTNNRLIPSATDIEAMMASVAPLTQGPCIMAAVGPYLYRFDFTWETFANMDQMCAHLTQHILSLPSLTFGQKLRVCVEAWRATNFLHQDGKSHSGQANEQKRRAIVHSDLSKSYTSSSSHTALSTHPLFLTLGTCTPPNHAM